MQNGFCRYCGLRLDNHSFLDKNLLVCPTKPDEIALPVAEPSTVTADGDTAAPSTPPADLYDAG